MKTVNWPCLISKNHEHKWQIWPETDGLEQRCAWCGEMRDTPKEDQTWNKAPAEKQSLPKIYALETKSTFGGCYETRYFADVTKAKQAARDCTRFACGITYKTLAKLV